MEEENILSAVHCQSHGPMSALHQVSGEVLHNTGKKVKDKLGDWTNSPLFDFCIRQVPHRNDAPDLQSSYKNFWEAHGGDAAKHNLVRRPCLRDREKTGVVPQCDSGTSLHCFDVLIFACMQNILFLRGQLIPEGARL